MVFLVQEMNPRLNVISVRLINRETTLIVIADRFKNENIERFANMTALQGVEYILTSIMNDKDTLVRIYTDDDKKHLLLDVMEYANASQAAIAKKLYESKYGSVPSGD